jgi:hypothetical protein
MKLVPLLFIIVISAAALSVKGQTMTVDSSAKQPSAEAMAKSDAEAEKKAAAWIASRQQNDPAK